MRALAASLHRFGRLVHRDEVGAKSGRAMIEALIDGVRRGQVLADLAKGKMRSKIPDVPMALEGRFGDHHAMLCRPHLDHLDHLAGMIAALDARVERMMQPLRAARDLPVTIPGPGLLSAAAVISEIGADVRACFPDAAHLASRAGLCPGNHESAGKRTQAGAGSAAITCGPSWRSVPGQRRHDGCLKALYHRHVMKRGGYRSRLAKDKAVIVVAHALLVMVWHVLATGKPCDDLGADYFTRRHDPGRETRRLIARLEALVTASPSRTPPPDLTASPQPAHKPRRLQPPARLGPFTHQPSPPGAAARLSPIAVRLSKENGGAATRQICLSSLHFSQFQMST
jgi:transposase